MFKIRPKKIIKRRKRKSAAWKYADQLEAGFIKCKLCGMVRQSFGGTSVIIQHLKNDHYELYLKEYGGSAQEGSAEKSKLVEELVSQKPQISQDPQKSPETEKSTVIKPISLKIKRISTNDNSLSVSYESELPNETVETALASSEPINPENEATQQSDMSDELGCAQVHITSSSINQQICINTPKPATRMNANDNNAQQQNGQGKTRGGGQCGSRRQGNKKKQKNIKNLKFRQKYNFLLTTFIPQTGDIFCP